MNIVMANSPYTYRDLEILFDGEDCIFSTAENITDLVVGLVLYKSKSQARAAGREGTIPSGFTKYQANKTTTIWVWNPSE